MLGYEERGFPLFFKCGFCVVFECLCVPASLPLFQDPSVCVTMGTGCFLSLPINPPTTTSSPYYHLRHLSPSLLQSLVSVLPWWHMAVSSLPATCFTCCPISLGHSLCVCVCFSACFSVCRWIFVCPWLAFRCLLLVFLAGLCFMYLHDCLRISGAVFLRPSLSVFAFCLTLFFSLFSLADWLPVWPPGIPTSNPSSPLSARLLCSVVLLTPTSLLSFQLLFSSFSPPDLFVCSHIKTASIECHWKHIKKKNFCRRQLLLWQHNFWICWGEQGMNRGIERGSEHVRG